MDPSVQDELVRACCDDCVAQLQARKSVTGVPVAAGMDLSPLLGPIVTGALDLMVTLLGPSIDRLVVSNRETIRAVLSDRVIEFIDGLVADLKATPLVGGAPEVPQPKGRSAPAVPQPKGRADSGPVRSSRPPRSSGPVGPVAQPQAPPRPQPQPAPPVPPGPPQPPAQP